MSMIDDLREVERLADLATPGRVELHTSCSWRRIMADRGRPFLVPRIDHDRHPNMDGIENAEFVVALVNWFRTHAAQIEQDARDAERIEWMDDNVTAIVCGEDFISVGNVIGYFREIIDDAMTEEYGNV